MFRFSRFFAALLEIASYTTVQAQSLSPAITAHIDAVVRRVLVEDGTPSASIAVVLRGRLAYARAYGTARQSPRVFASARTRYQLASISKTFTAQAVLLLEQDGKLSLDDPVSRWLPTLTQADRVTVRQLLTHTSGYPDHYPQVYPAGPRMQPTTPEQILQEWGRHPLLFKPGSKFHYSNLNYVIAGRIVEQVAGTPLFHFLRQRIFEPLGMTDVVDLDATGAGTPDLAVGYVRPALAALQPAPSEGRGWSFGAGQVLANATDLARWDEAFLAGKLLSAKQRLEEITPPELADGSLSAYALGLFVSDQSGRPVYDHVGQGLGFLTVNRIYPTESAAIVVLTNDSSSNAFAQIADRIAYLTVPPTPADAQARAVFASLQANRPERSSFTQDLNTYLDATMARQYAASLGPLGAPESFVVRSTSKADGITTRNYEVMAGGRKLLIVEQTLSDGRIESFQVQPAAH